MTPAANDESSLSTPTSPTQAPTIPALSLSLKEQMVIIPNKKILQKQNAIEKNNFQTLHKRQEILEYVIKRHSCKDYVTNKNYYYDHKKQFSKQQQEE